MTSQNFWMIRAGAGGRVINDFKEKNLVAIGWCESIDLSKISTKQNIKDLIASTYPENSQHQNNMIAGQVFRFVHEIKVGDRIVTYDSTMRSYLVGNVSTGAYFDLSQIHSMPNCRQVEWKNEVSRDLLSVNAKNSLGSIMTLFRISPEISSELLSCVKNSPLQSHQEPNNDVIEDEADLLKDVQARSLEFIKDRVSRLDWESMQILVADILTAMGYKTRISPPGSDRGKDIIASPDGFGFEQPRIVVEVKHRKGKMGAPEIRSFLGGRHKDDKGLYVSTGGFTNEARYEADRATIPLTLMDLDDLVIALVENYDSMRVNSRALIPLEKVYWPIDN
ncbi:MAG: restriction endonuclease [Waddliaceae bacterium]